MHVSKLIYTSSFRLTAAYAALFSLSALILFLLIYSGTSRYIKADLSNAIASDLAELHEIHRTQGNDALIKEIESRMRQADNADMMYLLKSAHGDVLAGNMPAITPFKEHLFEITIPADKSPNRQDRVVYAKGIFFTDKESLTVAADTASLQDMRSVILRSFAFSFGITLLLAFVGGVLVSRKLLLHVERISQTGRDIMGGNLSVRIPVRGIDDEFDHLSNSLNLMLDQIERLVDSLRQVSNDIAHDLRTPLTRLRQRLERAQNNRNSVENLREAIDRSIAETDGILETFGALLRIAQIESATSQQKFSKVNLSEVLTTVVEIHQSTAEEKQQNITVNVEQNLRVLGDRHLLTQMFSNLLENAIRHCPEKSSIELTGRANLGVVEITIADDGPGIPVTERNNVFRRFYRLESSRSTPGNGLGLSLVAAVAEGHNAVIALKDKHPGLCVMLQFPDVSPSISL